MLGLKTALLSSLSFAVTSILTNCLPVWAADRLDSPSFRLPGLLKPRPDNISNRAGITPRNLFAKNGCDQRILSSIKKSPTIVSSTLDIDHLDVASKLSIAHNISDHIVNINIPHCLHHHRYQWIGRTVRARTVYPSKDRVNQDTLTYERLVDPNWKNRISTQSRQQICSISSKAPLIDYLPQGKAKIWGKRRKKNLAAKLIGSNRAIVQPIYSSECNIALGDTYCLGKILIYKEMSGLKDSANFTQLTFPNGVGRGTHIIPNDMVEDKCASNRGSAYVYWEYLSNVKTHTIYRCPNFGYPLTAGVESVGLVTFWREPKTGSQPPSNAAKLRKGVTEIAGRVKIEDGSDV